MNVHVSIVVNEGEEFPMTPEEAATAVLGALDGVSAANDFCAVTITSSQKGAIGSLPPPPGGEPVVNPL
jgi:hypothetical protein